MDCWAACMTQDSSRRDRSRKILMLRSRILFVFAGDLKIQENNHVFHSLQIPSSTLAVPATQRAERQTTSRGVHTMTTKHLNACSSSPDRLSASASPNGKPCSISEQA